MVRVQKPGEHDPNAALRRRRRGVSAVAAVAAVIGGLALAGPAQAVVPSATVARAASVVSPQVVHTGTGPTGYSVTFRFADAAASSVRIKGEWSFATSAEIAANPTNPNPDFGATWKKGDIPVPSPLAGSAGNWPVTQMTEDKATGVWSYTTPLPPGVFTYSFFVDCTAAAPALTGCTGRADPLNPPWSTAGSVEATSQVYVPSDPRFTTNDLAWQAPTYAALAGKLTHVTYSSPGHVSPTDENYLSVYTPPGYDAKRATPYPTFYLVHGGGGNEMDWSTQGDLKNILDNLIAEKKIQPMIVVMPNNPTDPEVLNDILPYVQAHYDVSTDPADRAFAGLSGGATVVENMLYQDTTEFGQYAVWSAPSGLPTAAEVANPQLKQLLGLHVGDGLQDLGGLAHGNIAAEQALLDAAGVPYVSYDVDGAHTWSYWRGALRDFLTKVAFRATTTNVSVTHQGAAPWGTSTVTATVASATAEPALPTGTVQVSVGGKPIGHAVWLVHGVAKVVVPATVHGTVTVAYTGADVYNASSGSATL